MNEKNELADDKPVSSAAAQSKNPVVPCEISAPVGPGEVEIRVVTQPISVDDLLLEDGHMLAYFDEQAEEHQDATGVTRRIHRKRSFAVSKMEPRATVALAIITFSVALLAYLIFHLLGKI